MALSATNEYLLLMRGTTWDTDLSPQETQDGLQAMMAWLDDLRNRGILTSGQPLSHGGGVVKSEGTVIDGPFIESKEAVGGYLMLNCATFEEALAAAQACPVLKHGLFIEVRPIVSNCEMAEEHEINMAQTTN